MRLVATARLEDGVKLGRDVLTGRADGMPLLRAGTRISTRYRAALERAGINAVWVDDSLSAGIEPTPAVNDETRAAATRAVAAAFESAQLALGQSQPLAPEVIDTLSSAVARIAADVLASGEVALALSDLGAADSYTLQHSINVTALGLLIGDRLWRERGYVDWRGRRTWSGRDERLSRLGLGLLVHDIGKLAVPQSILNKPSELDPEEWILMRSHPLAGVDLLRSDLISPLVKVVVRSHHERWDGSGYPDGKSGDEIHEFARIAAVADVYDALRQARPHRPGLDHASTVAQMLAAPGQFDPAVREAFKACEKMFEEIELTIPE